MTSNDDPRLNFALMMLRPLPAADAKYEGLSEQTKQDLIRLTTTHGVTPNNCATMLQLPSVSEVFAESKKQTQKPQKASQPRKGKAKSAKNKPTPR